MGGGLGEFTSGKRWAFVGVFPDILKALRSRPPLEPEGSVAGLGAPAPQEIRPLSLQAQGGAVSAATLGCQGTPRQKPNVYRR